jgi:ParB-like chromosome segregation protein Spo0J
MKTQFCGYDVHPAANLFPMMTDDEFDELLDDIREHGQILPIILHDNKILDGRNRAMACHRLGKTPKVEILTCDDPISWAISANAKRRNLSKSQLAMVAAESLPLYEAEAKERQKMGKQRIADPEEIGQARDKAAKATGVNRQYVSDAKRIADESPELAGKVKLGEVTIQEAKRDLSAGREWETKGTHRPAESAPEDEDPEQLFNLKRIWKRTPKTQRAAFLKWIKTAQ